MLGRRTELRRSQRWRKGTMNTPNLAGLIAAIVTPMRDDFSVDEASLRRYTRWLVDQGVLGLAVNVDTGEGPHLFPDERLRVLEIVKEEVAGRALVVAGLAALVHGAGPQARARHGGRRRRGAPGVPDPRLPGRAARPGAPGRVPRRGGRGIGPAADRVPAPARARGRQLLGRGDHPRDGRRRAWSRSRRPRSTRSASWRPRGS